MQAARGRGPGGGRGRGRVGGRGRGRVGGIGAPVPQPPPRANPSYLYKRQRQHDDGDMLSQHVPGSVHRFFKGERYIDVREEGDRRMVYTRPLYDPNNVNGKRQLIDVQRGGMVTEDVMEQFFLVLGGAPAAGKTWAAMRHVLELFLLMKNGRWSEVNRREVFIRVVCPRTAPLSTMLDKMVKFLLTEEMQKEYVSAAVKLFQRDEATEFCLKSTDLAHYIQTLQQQPLELRNTGRKKKELLESIMSKASVQIMTTLQMFKFPKPAPILYMEELTMVMYNACDPDGLHDDKQVFALLHQIMAAHTVVCTDADTRLSMVLSMMRNVGLRQQMPYLMEPSDLPSWYAHTCTFVFKEDLLPMRIKWEEEINRCARGLWSDPTAGDRAMTRLKLEADRGDDPAQWSGHYKPIGFACSTLNAMAFVARLAIEQTMLLYCKDLEETGAVRAEHRANGLVVVVTWSGPDHVDHKRDGAEDAMTQVREACDLALRWSRKPNIDLRDPQDPTKPLQRVMPVLVFNSAMGHGVSINTPMHASRWIDDPHGCTVMDQAQTMMRTGRDEKYKPDREEWEGVCMVSAKDDRDWGQGITSEYLMDYATSLVFNTSATLKANRTMSKQVQSALGASEARRQQEAAGGAAAAAARAVQVVNTSVRSGTHALRRRLSEYRELQDQLSTLSNSPDDLIANMENLSDSMKSRISTVVQGEKVDSVREFNSFCRVCERLADEELEKIRHATDAQFDAEMQNQFADDPQADPRDPVERERRLVNARAMSLKDADFEPSNERLQLASMQMRKLPFSAVVVATKAINIQRRVASLKSALENQGHRLVCIGTDATDNGDGGGEDHEQANLISLSTRDYTCTMSDMMRMRAIMPEVAGRWLISLCSSNTMSLLLQVSQIRQDARRSHELSVQSIESKLASERDVFETTFFNCYHKGGTLYDFSLPGYAVSPDKNEMRAETAEEILQLRPRADPFMWQMATEIAKARDAAERLVGNMRRVLALKVLGLQANEATTMEGEDDAFQIQLVDQEAVYKGVPVAPAYEENAAADAALDEADPMPDEGNPPAIGDLLGPDMLLMLDLVEETARVVDNWNTWLDKYDSRKMPDPRDAPPPRPETPAEIRGFELAWINGPGFHRLRLPEVAELTSEWLEATDEQMEAYDQMSEDDAAEHNLQQETNRLANGHAPRRPFEEVDPADRDILRSMRESWRASAINGSTPLFTVYQMINTLLEHALKMRDRVGIAGLVQKELRDAVRVADREYIDDRTGNGVSPGAYDAVLERPDVYGDTGYDYPDGVRIFSEFMDERKLRQVTLRLWLHSELSTVAAAHVGLKHMCYNNVSGSQIVRAARITSLLMDLRVLTQPMGGTLGGDINACLDPRAVEWINAEIANMARTVLGQPWQGMHPAINAESQERVESLSRTIFTYDGDVRVAAAAQKDSIRRKSIILLAIVDLAASQGVRVKTKLDKQKCLERLTLEDDISSYTLQYAVRTSFTGNALTEWSNTTELLRLEAHPVTRDAWSQPLLQHLHWEADDVVSVKPYIEIGPVEDEWKSMRYSLRELETLGDGDSDEYHRLRADLQTIVEIVSPELGREIKITRNRPNPNLAVLTHRFPAAIIRAKREGAVVMVPPPDPPDPPEGEVAPMPGLADQYATRFGTINLGDAAMERFVPAPRGWRVDVTNGGFATIIAVMRAAERHNAASQEGGSDLMPFNNASAGLLDSEVVAQAIYTLLEFMRRPTSALPKGAVVAELMKQPANLESTHAWSVCRYALLRGDAGVAFSIARENSLREQRNGMQAVRRMAYFSQIKRAVLVAYAAVEELDKIGRTRPPQDAAERRHRVRQLCGDQGDPLVGGLLLARHWADEVLAAIDAHDTVAEAMLACHQAELPGIGDEEQADDGGGIFGAFAFANEADESNGQRVARKMHETVRVQPPEDENEDDRQRKANSYEAALTSAVKSDEKYGQNDVDDERLHHRVVMSTLLSMGDQRLAQRVIKACVPEDVSDADRLVALDWQAKVDSRYITPRVACIQQGYIKLRVDEIVSMENPDTQGRLVFERMLAILEDQVSRGFSATLGPSPLVAYVRELYNAPALRSDMGQAVLAHKYGQGLREMKKRRSLAKAMQAKSMDAARAGPSYA